MASDLVLLLWIGFAIYLTYKNWRLRKALRRERISNRIVAAGGYKVALMDQGWPKGEALRAAKRKYGSPKTLVD